MNKKNHEHQDSIIWSYDVSKM